MKQEKEVIRRCPYVTTQLVLRGKWVIPVLVQLSHGPVRFNELQRRLPKKLTHTALAKQLKALEGAGMVARHEYSQIPPKVEYSLTEIGQEFLPVLEAFKTFGTKYVGFLDKNPAAATVIDNTYYD